MPPRAERTLLLTERARRVCRLAPADVAFLAVQHASRFELLPTGQRHTYALTPGGFVGIVQAPTVRLIVRSKIPLANLGYLLDPLSPYLSLPDRSSSSDGREAFAFLAGQFLLRLRERIAAGLQRGYDERETVGPFLLGRLDVAAQLRESSVRKDVLHCRHDAFTTDVLCNRAAKAAVETALASPLLDDETRSLLQTELAAFAEVRPLVLTPNVWAALDGSAPAAYQPLLDLGRLLCEGLTPGETAGAASGPAFLLNLEQVFERFLTRQLRQAVEQPERCRARFQVESQPLIRVATPVAGQTDLNIRPDLLLSCENTPRLLVDAKWKRLGTSPLIPADIYQVLAYGSALGVRRAMLVYPGRRDRSWRYRLERGDRCILIRTLRVSGSRDELTRSTRRLMNRLLHEAAHGAGG